MSKMLLTTTSPFQKKLLQTAKGRRRPLCKALLVGEGGVGGLQAAVLSTTPMLRIGYGAGRGLYPRTRKGACGARPLSRIASVDAIRPLPQGAHKGRGEANPRILQKGLAHWRSYFDSVTGSSLKGPGSFPLFGPMM